MNLNLLSNFPPEYKPNEAQQYILSEMSKALEQKHRFIIIQAPTASGKSMISKTLANLSEEPNTRYVQLVQENKIFHSGVYNPDNYPQWGCAILTSTKSLQDQYGRLFSDGSVSKGKVNYECVADPTLNCQHGYCRVSSRQKDKCIKEHKCPYFNALNTALINKCAFYSYSMYGCLPPHVKARQFVVCDEASELESEIVSEYTCEVRFEQLKHLIGSFDVTPSSEDNHDEWWLWLSNIYKMVSTELGIVNNKMEEMKREKKKIPASMISRLSQLSDISDEMRTALEAWDLTDYIIERSDKSITFKPFQVNLLAKSFFGESGTIVLMSATIVDVKRFARTLGINEYYFIDAPCTLDPKRAPIVCSPDTYISYKTKNQVLPVIMEKIRKIMKKFPNKKGLVHTHSMEFLRYFKNNINDETNRFIYREDGVVNEAVLSAHSQSSEPTVMVSPSMTHGIDLKGELGEFQIIMKAPYPPLGDARVKKKFDLDKQWYTNCMLSTLIQASGRCNRVKSDESVTFIMDANALEAIKRNRNILPKYFLDRLI